MPASSLRNLEVPGAAWLRSGSEVAKRRLGRLWEVGTESAQVGGSCAGTLERMFAAVDGVVDEALARRREAASARAGVDLSRSRRGLPSGSRRSCVRPMTMRDWRAAGCSSSAQWFAQVSSSDHRTRGADHEDERRASQPAGARPRAEHGRVDARPGRGRCGVRDARERCRARARRGRQAAERDRAGRAHARAARGRRRRGAVCATGAEHDVDARAARAVSERPAAARAGRDLRAGDLGHRQAAARRRQADRQRASSGSSRPPTRSSHSPNTAAAASAVVCGAARRR